MKIYVEGGGNSKDVQIRCQQAFHKLLEKARPGQRKPRIVAYGGREQAFDAFRTAHSNASTDEIVVLLVDSEAPVKKTPWAHLADRDQWVRPAGASDDQCQLMVACMETWILADRVTLRRIFRQDFVEKHLFTERNLETRTKEDIQGALEMATRGCPEDRRYTKGKRSFQVLAEINPRPLQENLPHFARLIEMLNRSL